MALWKTILATWKNIESSNSDPQEFNSKVFVEVYWEQDELLDFISEAATGEGNALLDVTEHKFNLNRIMSAT